MHLNDENPMSTTVDFLSPFEELVLTAIAEIGHGAFEAQIWSKVRDLSGRDDIAFKRVQFTLEHLQRDCCVYSWSKDPESEPYWMRHYRIQFRGERALEAAIERRPRSARDYFHRASRFGILWDIWRARRSRKRAERRAWWGRVSGRGENV